MIRGTLCTIALSLLTAGWVSAADWSQWRGPNRDGVVKSDISRWPKTLTRKWRLVVGEGHASPVVSGKHVFIFSREKDRETVRCLELKTGRPIWIKHYDAPYKMHPAARGHGKGPKSTPLVAGGKLYTFGISGILSCFETSKGRLVWRNDFTKSYKNSSPLYGTSTSPILHKGLLILHVGGHNKGALMAFDAGTGAEKWKWDDDGPGYASPVILKAAGVEQLVTQTQNSILGVNPANGKALWQIAYKTAYDQNSVTPVVNGQTVIISGYGNGVDCYRFVKVGTRIQPRKVWSKREISMYMNTAVISGKAMFGMSHRNSGEMFCASPETGKVFWTGKRRFAKNAALIAAGDAILVQKTDGEMLVFEPSFERMTIKARYRLSQMPTWAHPAIAGKLLLVKDKTALICYAAE